LKQLNYFDMLLLQLLNLSYDLAKSRSMHGQRGSTTLNDTEVVLV